MTFPNGRRECDCCGVLLTKDNNKCGYEICDKCNEKLENYMEEKNDRQEKDSTNPHKVQS